MPRSFPPRTLPNPGLLLLNLGLLLTVLVGPAPAAGDSDPAMPVDLTGVWNLDAMASDDLAARLEPLAALLAERAQAQQPKQGFGDEAGLNTGNRARPRPGGGKGPAPDPNLTRDIVQSLEQLLITVDGADVEIMDGSDRSRVWTPGGRPVQRPGPGGQVLEQAWWDGDELVLSTTGGPLIITRRLHREDDGKTLVVDVDVKVSRSAEHAEARLVYHGY
jgi:hypothetical protein